MTEIINDPGLVAKCGLYCGACGKYQKGKCGGCAENEKATWCKIRACCMENDYRSCAECAEFETVTDCKKFNNFFAKVFALVFRSNRPACIEMIKEKGYDDYAAWMAEHGLQSIKR